MGYSSENSNDFFLPNSRDPFYISQSELDSLHTGLTPIPEDQVDAVSVIENLENHLQPSEPDQAKENEVEQITTTKIRGRKPGQKDQGFHICTLKCTNDRV